MSSNSSNHVVLISFNCRDIAKRVTKDFHQHCRIEATLNPASPRSQLNGKAFRAVLGDMLDDLLVERTNKLAKLIQVSCAITFGVCTALIFL